MTIRRSLLLLALVLGATVPASSRQLTRSPRPLHLYPRSLSTNTAEIGYEGTLTDATLSGVELLAYDDSETLVEQETRALTWVNGRASLSIAVELPARLTNYRIELRGRRDGSSDLLHHADSVVVGDVFLINGQSNAEAARYVGDANVNRSGWIRSFGSTSDDAQEVFADRTWSVAEGNFPDVPGFVGQWGIRLARLLVDGFQVPVAFLNGAQGGQPIANFRRYTINPLDLTTNYGRLLYRTDQAGVRDGIRGIFWYQGEHDGSNEAATTPAEYITRFTRIYESWKGDFPSVERVFVFQVRSGCGSPLPPLRNAQRRLADLFSDVVLMSTTGIGGHDDCHFSYDPGYRQIGENVYRQVARELYGETIVADVDPPNPAQAYFSTPDRTEVAVVMRAEGDHLTWNEGAELDFSVAPGAAAAVSGRIDGSALVLTLDRPAPENSRLAYGDRRGVGASWVTNGNGVGLLSFSDIRIRPDRFRPPNDVVAASTERGIELGWQGVQDSELLGYSIYRDTLSPALELLASVGPGSASFIDRNVVLGTRYFYRLTTVDSDGSESGPSVEISVDVVVPVARERDVKPPTAPAPTLAAFPNPFRSEAWIVLQTEQFGDVDLAVYDVSGRRAAVLFSGPLAAGRHETPWSPRGLAPGLYLAVLTTSSGRSSIPLVYQP